MSSENVTETSRAVGPQPSPAVDRQLIDELVARALAEGLQFTGVAGVRSGRGDDRPPGLRTARSVR
ncbi:hypothetical protein [Longimycelium tulufanense]|uniref:hypothetical protein n=1 Tax=Longimycelium tulufanense TaxID=907463 RepID=UPI0016678844|nr:hypothetical protein [Longimycelium tulufanense]